MIPELQVLPLETFTRLPESLHVRDRQSDFVDIQWHGAPTPCFLEGPSFDRAGNLWVVDIPWGRILRITPSGDVSVEFEYDGYPNGLKFHRDGRAFITDHKHGIMVLDTERRRIEPFLTRVMLTPFQGVNDLVFASNGDLYFTDQGQSGLHDPSGRLYRVQADGAVECVLDGIPSPNGLVLDRTERIIYLAVTRANAIWRVPMLPNGRATKVGNYIQMSGGSGPDGMAIDEDDNLVVCNPRLGVVWVYSNVGEPIIRLQGPKGAVPTNCAFGGPDRRTLYVTDAKNGAILTARLPVPGRLMYSHTTTAPA